jgi:tRNA(His) guanylyltransferase
LTKALVIRSIEQSRKNYIVKDNLGDRLKVYEAPETARKLIPGVPVYARLDGRSFSKFTRNMIRPFDPRLHETMVSTTQHLVDQSGATIGYTSSDELSLGWATTDHTQQLWFDSKIHKITSVLASLAASAFVKNLIYEFDNWRELLDHIPHFDCRVMQVPNLDELANCFLWRSLDCTKNAVSMAAHHAFGHNQLQGKNTKTKKLMLNQAGVDFDQYPSGFTKGTFVRKTTVERQFSESELDQIPPQYRPKPNMLIKRTEIESFDLPPLINIANLKQTLFSAKSPQLKETQ